MSITENEAQEEKSNLKGYIIFGSGQLISLLGSNIITFVIVWWITVETASALYLSLAIFIGFIPAVVLTPIAGVFVDRWGRKALLGSVDFLQAVATVALLFLFWFDISNLGIVLGFLARRVVFQAFHTPAIQAIIPIMVPRKHLNRVNSVEYLFNGVIFLIGPLIAAVLYSLMPIQHILWIDAVTFIIAVIPLFLIKIPKIKKEVIKKKREASFFSEFKEGVLFIKERKGLLSLLSVFTAANFFLVPLFVLINLFVYLTHGGNETHLSYVLAFNQAGMIAGSVLLIFWKGFKKKVHGVIIGIFLSYLGYLMLTLTPNGLFWFMGLAFLVIGFALPLANISSQTIWQAVVPKEKLGRVMSVRITIAQITAPLGMIVSGLIAEVIDLQYVFIGAAVLGLFFLGLSWFGTNMRRVEEGIDFVNGADAPVDVELPAMDIPEIDGTSASHSVDAAKE